MSVDKKISYEKPVVQGGVDNYLGKQPQVQAPRKWQSAPDKPATELAYITEAEKDLILKANIHGGLEGGPNMGPSGIMSLDSFGDIGGAGASGGDTSASGGAMDGRGFSGRNTNTTSEREFDRQKANQRAALQIAERAQAKNLGYKERQNIADKTYGPMQKYSGDGFLGGYKGGGRKGGLGGILGTIVGMMMGIPGLGLLTGGFGRLKEGLGSLGDTIGDTLGNFREKTTGFRTQAEYDAARQQRQLQSRLDNLYDRKATGKGFSQKNIDMLESKYGLSPSRDTITSAINRDLQTNPETPQFARSYLQSVAKNLPTSNPFRNTVGTTTKVNNPINDAVSSYSYGKAKASMPTNPNLATTPVENAIQNAYSGVKSIGTKGNSFLSGLYNPEQIAALENKYGNQYGIENSATGPLSDARHMAAMNNLSNSLSPFNNKFGNFIGDTGAFAAGLINELPALGRGFNTQNLGEIVEDIKANYAGSFGTPNTTSAQQIYDQVFNNTNKFASTGFADGGIASMFTRRG